LTLAAVGFERYAKTTRRAAFLAEMERVVPWSALCALIEPFYPKPGNGRPPVGVERMLRIYFLQQWFNLSDPAVEEALYDSLAMRRFVDIDLGREPVPDETTLCRFRHLLEAHDLGQQRLGAVFRPLDLIDNTAVAVAAIGEIAGLGSMLPDHRPLSAVGLITPYPGLLPVQQFGQHRAVGDIGRRRHHGVDQLGAAVHPQMRLHAEIPLVALLGLVHLGVACLVGILGRRRRIAKVRARVEHAIGVIKRMFGFAKVRYRGLKKNTHRLLVTCALANLFMVRRHLLRCQGA
jgi:IS5 family transposase